jgi:LacI family transcriptional regulator
VPEDVGLVAIDDPFWAELVDPPLTTLAQPIQQMAESAVQLLFNRIEGDRGTQTTCLMFAFALRARGSCGVQG